VPGQDNDEDYARVMEYRGARKVSIVDLVGRRREAFVSEIACDKQCPAAEAFKCRIYDARPRMCVNFPTPDDLGYLALADKCTFSFQKVKELRG